MTEERRRATITEVNATLIALAVTAGFLKGQLHVHTSQSSDGKTAPAEVARWYEEHGYDFIVMTDHEAITVERSRRGLLVLPGVELTQNSDDCEPRPRPGLQCLLHMNALVLASTPSAVPWAPVTSKQRVDLYQRGLDVTQRLGGVPQLNHPNFHFAADAEIIAALVPRGLRLMEIANQSWDVNNAPYGKPSTEALWDAVLGRGLSVWGTATDDAHHFYDADDRAAMGEPVFRGDRGFVMVRARKDAASIRSALERGDFYSSTGVYLGKIDRTATELVVALADKQSGEATFRFIGKGGVVLSTVRGREARFELATARGGYVRAVIEDDKQRRAWTQPIFVTSP